MLPNINTSQCQLILTFVFYLKVLDITEKARIEGHHQEPSLTNEQLCIIFAVCHATGMLSACANPIIYGFLNENFHRVFIEIISNVRKTLAPLNCFNVTSSENEPSSSNVNDRQNNLCVSSTKKYDFLQCCGKRNNCCRKEESSNNIPIPVSDLSNRPPTSLSAQIHVSPNITLNSNGNEGLNRAIRNTNNRFCVPVTI